MGPKWALLGPGVLSGPGGLPYGPGKDFASFGPSFSPYAAILGPIGPLFVFEFPKKNILGPNSSKSSLGPVPIGPRAPSNMGPRAHGGQRPTFGGVLPGGAPPLQRGGYGAAAAPHRKESPGAIANSEIRNPVWYLNLSLHSVVALISVADRSFYMLAAQRDMARKALTTRQPYL